MRDFITVIVCLVLVLKLQSQIITDRPDQTESSSTVGKGNLQIESGIVVSYEGGSKNTTRQILAPTNLFRFGVGKNIELRLLNQFETLKNDHVSIQGISDFEIGTKIQLIKSEDINTEIAFLSHLILPTGTTLLSNDQFGTINKLSISHQINEQMSLGYNLGYNYFGNNSGDFTYSCALGSKINEKVGIYIEPYGEILDFGEFISNIDAGFTYLLNDNFQFDFSYGLGINAKMNYISIGFSWLTKKN